MALDVPRQRSIVAANRCPSRLMLIAAARGTLNAPALHEIQKHIGFCDPCFRVIQLAGREPNGHSLSDQIPPLVNS